MIKRGQVIPSKPKTIMEMKWNSLSQLKDHFEKTGEETVIEFNGATLVTKKYVYGLAFSELSRRKR